VGVGKLNSKQASQAPQKKSQTELLIPCVCAQRAYTWSQGEGGVAKQTKKSGSQKQIGTKKFGSETQKQARSGVAPAWTESETKPGASDSDLNKTNKKRPPQKNRRPGAAALRSYHATTGESGGEGRG
jgi:hypothetical protein